MTLPQLTKATSINMQQHPAINEQWVEDQIVKDTSLLGLGELKVIERQKSQPTGGRLDLLLRDPNTQTRYEVELQLGATDPSHIIRAIEYWDVERRRYPHYEHVAVIVAEDVTGRFFNVINLFNGMIPLIAIQMQCVEVGSNHALIATRVLDRVLPGIEEEDGVGPADEASWDAKDLESMSVFCQILEMIRKIDSGIQPAYRQAHISLQVGGKVSTSIVFYPQKWAVRTSFRVPHDQDLTDALDEAGFDNLSKSSGEYNIKIRKGDIEEHHELLLNLIQRTLNSN